jgi:hypothetical protein
LANKKGVNSIKFFEEKTEKVSKSMMENEFEDIKKEQSESVLSQESNENIL